MSITEQLNDLGAAVLASRSGVSRPHITNVLAGRDRFSPSACVAVAQASGLDLGQIVSAHGGTLAVLQYRLAVAECRDPAAALGVDVDTEPAPEAP